MIIVFVLAHIFTNLVLKFFSSVRQKISAVPRTLFFVDFDFSSPLFVNSVKLVIRSFL